MLECADNCCVVCQSGSARSLHRHRVAFGFTCVKSIKLASEDALRRSRRRSRSQSPRNASRSQHALTTSVQIHLMAGHLSDSDVPRPRLHTAITFLGPHCEARRFCERGITLDLRYSGCPPRNTWDEIQVACGTHDVKFRSSREARAAQSVSGLA